MHFAHSLENQPPENWEQMHEHEELVAQYCREFLTRINAEWEPWGELLGRWHDLGKYSNEFQTYLHKSNEQLHRLRNIHRVEISGKVDHSTAAAQLAAEKFGPLGKLLAYPFAGHHAGLPDWDDGSTQTGLRQRLKKDIFNYQTNAPSKLLDMVSPAVPKFPSLENDGQKAERASFRLAFWIRIIFSALVDADFLATESFLSPNRKQERTTKTVTLQEMTEHLEAYVGQMDLKSELTVINKIRKQISNTCQEKAHLPPGLFSLNVPTGGGKTISGLRFALHHAIAHELDRIIVAIPFTSIIEQNANVYRNVFSELGNDVVLEHHSSLDPEKESSANRLQAENWDAPLVVTTNVQLFESLFASRTSRCRKLHRIAGSVIILDEAQTLPVELLKPTLFAIKELVEVYRCTVIFCTATQPAFDYRDDFRIGFQSVTPIIDQPRALHSKLKRVRVNEVGKIHDDMLSEKISELNQVLCIVNTRPHAAKIFQSLPDSDGNFHLSTRMCAAHRQHVLDNEVRPRLQPDCQEPCRVISTQLIEAGVDIDFPVVYRAIAGLDSLAQAAGRCNREGRNDMGQVYFFKTEKLPPPGILRQSAESASELLGQFDDLLSPEAIEQYFQLHYWKKSDSWDRQQVLKSIGNQPNRMEFNFREAAKKYKFIREETQTVLVPWDKTAKDLIQKLETEEAEFLGRRFWRQLQRYGVQVRKHELSRLNKAGAVMLNYERWVLIQDHLYDHKLGLVLDRADGVLPVEDTII
ncbi:MAG: CRISPR-associated helicase Cas3' [Planctomycetota bacterium]